MDWQNLFKLGSLLESLLSFDLAIDFGSWMTRVIVKDKGLVIKEPTVIARQKKRLPPEMMAISGSRRQVLAIGKKAYQMIGKEPAGVEVVRPIKHGVVVDFDSAFALLDHFFSLIKEIPRRFPQLIGPRVVVAIPSIATEVERRALKSLLEKVGAREIFLVEKPLLAAIGIGLPIEDAGGIFLIDLGGDTVEIAVISLAGIVVGQCLKIGGQQADEALVNYLRLKYGILIGEQTALKLKEKIGSLLNEKTEQSMVVRGRDLESGLPKSLRIKTSEVRESLVPLVQKIVISAKEVLEESPPELTQDFLRRGIVLTGGFAQLKGIDKMITQELGIGSWIAQDSELAVIKGAAKLLDEPKLLKRVRLVAGLR